MKEKTKILLINPIIRLNSPPMHFPSGLGYIAAVLLREEYDVKVLDIDGYRYNKKKVEEELKRYILHEKINIIGIGCLITCYNYVKWLNNTIKKISLNVKIIMGGGLATSIPQYALNKLKADICVLGEGDIIIKDLISAITKRKNLSTVKGIAYKIGNKIVKTEQPERIENLDDIPFPAWHLFPVEIYINNLQKELPTWSKDSDSLKGRGIDIVSGRGCPYRCTYCYHIFGHQNRLRSVENVIKEIEFLKGEYGIETVYFADDLFMVRKEWTIKLCDELIKRKINIRWATTGRVNLIEERLLKKMKEAGCKALQFGIESGSQKMLNIMNKQVTNEQASNALRITRKLGIGAATCFMMGFPEETIETIEETIKFCIKNEIHLVTIFLVSPYPGTELYEQAQKKGLIKDEEKYIGSLGNVSDFVINLTKWSDKELLRLRDYAIMKVRRAYFKKHKIEYFSWLLKKQKWYLSYIRTRGLHSFLNEAGKKLIKIINQ